MTIREFKEHVKTRKLLDTEEIHQFMDIMSNEARRITLQHDISYAQRGTRTAFRTVRLSCSLFISCISSVLHGFR